MVVIHRSVDQLLMELLDHATDSITEIVPSASCWLVTSAEPLHGFIEHRFLAPLCRRSMFLEVLIEHHLEHRHGVVCKRPDAAIELFQDLMIEKVDLSFDDLSVIVMIEFRRQCFPSRFGFRQRVRTKPGFLIVSTCLHSCRPPCDLWK